MPTFFMEKSSAASKYHRIPIEFLLNKEDCSPLEALAAHAVRTASGESNLRNTQCNTGTSLQQPMGGEKNAHVTRNEEDKSFSGSETRAPAYLSRWGRKRWTEEEDEIVMKAVREHGPRKWDSIAKLLPDRNGQHVRLRYNNYLRFSENEKERPFTEKEDMLIMQARNAASGSHRWGRLADTLGRSNSAVKNRYHLLERHMRKDGMKGAPILQSISPLLSTDGTSQCNNKN
uniref:Uncharacterized protein n=1 Tax=Timspurckia oligopyrenoides TaxID=708627 RepID=A0A7S0ZFE3_9RHOD|mmetsp:Transcript_3056/g.5395  ORF Transcript_3056/g.5395 Transcript_3056/m.5395 type:complete len:231 (+) Transcript_3056:292-984(+)|eukprot:CAMPEP_0182442406 /NCGR_PEP_ID=MMETSP1172-20130603/1313_1 /TAXON_ID=708627 /ORGANISM="Timspurckia oligopyrenoides, Strain CCMP3278" /LENGTH=230 /DNA_ID=CAMNT_0024637223 /DNA_START=285 /DNA_END=977 /DNA_ORIENTATION=+